MIAKSTAFGAIAVEWDYSSKVIFVSACFDIMGIFSPPKHYLRRGHGKTENRSDISASGISRDCSY